MPHRISKTAALVATAATAAFAAYAIGSQTNSSGTAGADAGAAQRYAYGPGPGSGGGPRHGDRDGRRGGPDRAAFLADLAAKLGVEPAALKAALQSLRPQPGPGDRGARRDHAAQALADALKVDKAKVTAALDKLTGDMPGDRDRGRFGPSDFAAALAKELGADPADVKVALAKLRADHQAQEQQQREAFAQKLADKLGISVEKVKRVMQDGPFGRHGGPGGPGVHGPRMHR